LTVDHDLDNLEFELFEAKDSKRCCANTRKVPFDVFISLVKFDMKPGSPQSIELLIGMEKAGVTNPEIFSIKMVQKLLHYKIMVPSTRAWGWFWILL
jgi:hypothetical protein